MCAWVYVFLRAVSVCVYVSVCVFVCVCVCVCVCWPEPVLQDTGSKCWHVPGLGCFSVVLLRAALGANVCWTFLLVEVSINLVLM